VSGCKRALYHWCVHRHAPGSAICINCLHCIRNCFLKKRVTGCVQSATPQRTPARKRSANGSARAVTQVRLNPGKMVSVCIGIWPCMHSRLPHSTQYVPTTSDATEEEEGLQGVFKRLRRNGHQLEKGCCEQLSSDCHSKGG
jgi:hypothetical protein